MNVSDNSNNTTGYEGGGNAIEYDQNGNMLNMEDKRINQIGYNYHNLPNALIIENNNKKLFYTYRADGTKLRKIFTFSKKEGGVFTTVTDYLDGFHYLTTLGSRPTESDPIKYAYEQEAYLEEVLEEKPLPRLQFYPTAEGFYDFEKNEYIYQYKDHLGNVRVSYKRGPTGQLEITDKNSYYPFGMNILREEKAIFGTASMYNYKYNDKELQETGIYDYGARFYMPDIGRWGVVDPLAETSRRWSVYTYAFNNPIRFIDPDGRTGQDWIKMVDPKTNQTTMTYDANIKTVDQAKEAGYANVDSVGATGEIKNGNGDITHTLNANGSVTNLANNSSAYGSSNIDGIEVNALDNRGSFWSFSANFAFGGGAGFSFGQVTDSNKETNWFFSLNGNLGLSAGAGFEKGSITPTDPGHKFVNSDFAGEGRAISGGAGYLSSTVAGTFTRSYDGYKNTDQFNPANFGRNTQTVKNGYSTISTSVGPGVGVSPVMWTASKTWVRGK